MTKREAKKIVTLIEVCACSQYDGSAFGGCRHTEELADASNWLAASLAKRYGLHPSDIPTAPHEIEKAVLNGNL